MHMIICDYETNNISGKVFVAPLCFCHVIFSFYIPHIFKHVDDTMKYSARQKCNKLPKVAALELQMS